MLAGAHCWGVVGQEAVHASTPGWTNAQRAALRPVALRPAPRHAALHDVKASSPTAWRAAKDAVGAAKEAAGKAADAVKK